MTRYPEWSGYEKRKLRSLYQDYTYKEISEMIPRKSVAANKKANRMGLYKNKNRSKRKHIHKHPL